MFFKKEKVNFKKKFSLSICCKSWNINFHKQVYMGLISLFFLISGLIKLWFNDGACYRVILSVN